MSDDHNPTTDRPGTRTAQRPDHFWSSDAPYGVWCGPAQRAELPSV
ncbi:hypothetical protein [Nocardioides flavus (ex Wang et al. 2016)]|nr:hypothetical protein [Nocardioides flavus (ex Wang et al. 2016)]